MLGYRYACGFVFQHKEVKAAWCNMDTVMQVEFAILGLLQGAVGLRGTLTAVGDNKDTVKVHV